MSNLPSRSELEVNRVNLGQNVYPGRGIVQGLSESGAKAVQAYWVMGRSVESKARILEIAEDPDAISGSIVKTAGFDLDPDADTSLIIYNAMREVGGQHIVSNGDQTDTIFDHLLIGKTFEDALATRTYEPDDPNFTPRVGGVIDLSDRHPDAPLATLSVIRRHVGGEASRSFFTFGLDVETAGIGYTIHTYEHDMPKPQPLPSFTRDPYPVAISEDAEEIAYDLWPLLNPGNRVALAVKTIDLKTKEEEVVLLNKNLGD